MGTGEDSRAQRRFHLAGLVQLEIGVGQAVPISDIERIQRGGAQIRFNGLFGLESLFGKQQVRATRRPYRRIAGIQPGGQLDVFGPPAVE